MSATSSQLQRLSATGVRGQCHASVPEMTYVGDQKTELPKRVDFGNTTNEQAMKYHETKAIIDQLDEVDVTIAMCKKNHTNFSGRL